MRLSYRFLTAYAVWLGSVCLFVEWSGALRWQLTPYTAWSFVAAALAVAFGFDRWACRALPAPQRTFPSAPPSRATAAAWAVAALAFAAYVLLWVPAYCRPDLSWDGMTYHLPTIHFWASKGYVHWIEVPPEAGTTWLKFTDALLNGYPKTGEVVSFTLARLSDGKLVNAANLVFEPLAIAGIAAIARELGASRGPAAAAGFLFALVPTNVGQAASTYVDTAFSSAVIGFLALVFLKLRLVLATPRATIPAPLAVASGAALGLALGLKGPALVVAGLATFALLVAMALRLRKRRTGRRRRVMMMAVAIGLMSTVAVPVGGFWYLRNAVYAHNPLHPFSVKLGRRVLFSGLPVDVVIRERLNTPSFMHAWSTPRKVLYTWSQSGRLEWPIDGAVEHNEEGYALDIPEAHEPAWPRSIRYHDPRSGGLGFLWLCGGIPSLLALLVLAVRSLRRGSRANRVRAERNVLSLGLLLATCAVFFTVTPMSWWARYTLWIHGIGLPALAVVAHVALCGLARRRLFALVGTAMLIALTSVALFEYAYALKWDHTPAYFVGPARVNRHSTLAQLWDSLTTTKEDSIAAIYVDLTREGLARDALSGGAVVALAPLAAPEGDWLAEMFNGPVVGQLSMSIGRRRWVMASADIGNDPEAAARFVQKHLPRYIIWDHELLGPPKVLLQTARRWAWLRSLMILEFGEEESAPVVIRPK
jgi:hypothetical protein